MPNILIVEDDMVQLNRLNNLMKSTYPDWNILTCYTFAEGMNIINDSIINGNIINLFLLDVQLSNDESNKDGFLLAERLRKHKDYYHTPLLFLTALSSELQYALKSFHCYDYICKPYTDTQLLQQIQQLILTDYLNTSNDLRIIDTSRIVHNISLDNIKYIESSGHIITIHTTSRAITTRQYTLNTIMPLIDSVCIRCHKQYIVNKRYVETIDSTCKVITIGSKRIKISKVFSTNEL